MNLNDPQSCGQIVESSGRSETRTGSLSTSQLFVLRAALDSQKPQTSPPVFVLIKHGEFSLNFSRKQLEGINSRDRIANCKTGPASVLQPKQVRRLSLFRHPAIGHTLCSGMATDE